MNNRGYVYIIQAAGTKRYKIGITTRSVTDRLGELQTGSPIQLAIVDCRQFDNCRGIEARLHEKFSHFRVPGLRDEWFEVERIDDVIRELRFLEMIESERNRTIPKGPSVNDILTWCTYGTTGTTEISGETEPRIDQTAPTFEQFISMYPVEIQGWMMREMISSLSLDVIALRRDLSYTRKEIDELRCEIRQTEPDEKRYVVPEIQ